VIKRILTWATAFALCLIGTATVAQAQVHTHAQPRSHSAGHQVKVINLHRAFEARLGHTKPGKIAGIVYARGKHVRAAQKRRACSEPNCPLTYNGGPVQHSPHVYLLLWGPAWSTNPGEEASASYLESFYAGLGAQPDDDWSTTTSQYGDGSGFPAFTGSVYEGTFLDTSTPPAGAVQSQLAAEADAFTANQGITDLNDAQIIVATQSGTCPQGFYAPGCASGTGNYCAWHSASNEPYTNLPYILDSGTGCGEDFVNPAGTYDGFSIVGGHEYAETITDPYPDSGWFDFSDSVSGGEIGDKCAWRGENWGGNDPAGDVTLSTGSFAMQSLWSNAKPGCVMSTPVAQDVVTVVNPNSQVTYQNVKVDLTVSGSSSGGYPLTWSATGLPRGLSIGSTTGQITGQPHNTGSYTVHVTASDQTTAFGRVTFTWTVLPVVGKAITGYAGKCLDDHNRLVTNGNTVDIYTCNGTGAQRWTFSGGELVVLGKCLYDPHSGGAGTSLVIWTCNGHNTELWTHRSNGEYVLKQNGLCLTDPSNSKVNGTPVQIRACHNSGNQHWSGP
jgi:serine protease